MTIVRIATRTGGTPLLQTILVIAVLGASLTGCGSGSSAQDNAAAHYVPKAEGRTAGSGETAASGPVVPTPAPSAPASSAAGSGATGDQSCSTELGAQAADRLVAQCRAVSPATHPPCNVANSCALVRDEITRSCGLLGPAEAGRTPACSAAATAPSPSAATAVVRDYYAAINAGEFQRAYRLWDRNGAASGKTFEQFRHGFVDTASTRVIIGEPRGPEGAAGSSFVTVPVTVTALGRAGDQRRFAGDYIMKRANDVAGATAQQRSWRIASAALQARR